MEEHRNPSEMCWQWKCWFPYENANTHIRKAQSTSNHYRISRFRSETMQYEINCIGPLFPAFSHTNKWIKRRHFFRSLVVAFPLSPEKIEEGLSHSYIIKRNNGCWFGYFVNCKWNREMRSFPRIDMTTKRIHCSSWTRSRIHALTHSCRSSFSQEMQTKNCVFSLTNTLFFSSKWMKRRQKTWWHKYMQCI